MFRKLTSTYMDGTAYIGHDMIHQDGRGLLTGEAVQQLCNYEATNASPTQILMMQSILQEYTALGSPQSLREKLEIKQAVPKAITSFRGKSAFLSNFYECEVIFDGIAYGSAEAAFQAQKCLSDEDKLAFAEYSPKKAKQEGRKVSCRSDWEQIKRRVMYEVIKEKFLQNWTLRLHLLNTGDAMLMEGNIYHDNTWGACTCPRCEHEAKRNYLGCALMMLRSEFRLEAAREVAVSLPEGKTLVATPTTTDYAGIDVMLLDGHLKHPVCVIEHNPSAAHARDIPVCIRCDDPSEAVGVTP